MYVNLFYKEFRSKKTIKNIFSSFFFGGGGGGGGKWD